MVRKCPFVCGFCFCEVTDLGMLADDNGLATGLGVEDTVTIFVAIFGAAFLAFIAENDKVRLSAGKDAILKRRSRGWFLV